MTDVFISYSRPDRARIAKLAAALEKVGYSVWWDMNLTGGAQFSKETGERLKEAKAVIVAWSGTSIESMWVADEATVGRTKKNLVPIAIDRVEPPLGFGQIHAIDFAEWDGATDDPAFVQLDKSLAALLARAPAAAARAVMRPLWRRVLAQARKRSAALAAAALAVVAVVLGALLVSRGGAPVPMAADAVAVLPFVNAGGAERDDYLSEGLADELRDQLGRVPGLRVSARASSVAFRDKKLGTVEIARQLGVARLVDGSLLRQKELLRISVQIIDGKTGFQIWSHTYQRKEADLLAIQQEIAASVVAAVAREGEAPAPATDDINAYDRLLLARHYDQEVRGAPVVDEEKLAKAIELYRAAVASDPNSALAHSRLAGALLYAGEADAAEPIIFRALNLDPNLSDVQYTLGVYYFARALPGVGAAFERAVALNPNNADALEGFGHQLWGFRFGPLDEVEALFRRAIEVDPLSLRRYTKLGYFYGVTGQRDRALALVKDIAGRFSDRAGYSAIAQILDQTGDHDLAIAAAKKALSLAPQSDEVKSQLAELYAQIGDYAAAASYEPDPGLAQLFWRRDYKRLIALAQDLVLDQPEDAQIWYLLGFAYSAEGDYDNAVRVLKITGLPEAAATESRIGVDQGALATLAGAFAELGRDEEARAVAETTIGYARKFLASGGDKGVWGNTLLSCALAVLGRDDEAMAAFERIDDPPGMPTLPWMKDHACFQRFAQDERYKSVIAAVEKRQAGLRARVAAMAAEG